MKRIKTSYQAFLNLPLRWQLRAFALLAAFLVAGAFMVEYGFKAQPCHLCWLQRYGHWAMLAIAFSGSFLPYRGQVVAMAGVLATSLYGFGYGVYHTLIQAKLIELPAGCGRMDMPTSLESFNQYLQNPTLPPRCDQVSFAVFGIPLPGWNILIMGAVIYLIFAIYRNRTTPKGA